MLNQLEVPISKLNFQVRYRLGEYAKLVFSHVVAEVMSRKSQYGKRVTWLDLLILRISFFIFIPPIFMFKVFKIGTCNFKIDEDKIVRSSKASELVVPWSNVNAIHEYASGYVIVKNNGAMPIPFSALTNFELTELRKFIVAQRVRLTKELN